MTNLKVDMESLFNKLFSNPKCNFDKIFGGFNKAEIGVIKYLVDNTYGVAAGELSNWLEVSTARIASILNSLESKGLIIRKSDSIDKRKILIEITEKGILLAQDIKKKIIDRITYLIEQMGIDKFLEYIDLSIYISNILNTYEESLC